METLDFHGRINQLPGNVTYIKFGVEWQLSLGSPSPSLQGISSYPLHGARAGAPPRPAAAPVGGRRLLRWRAGNGTPGLRARRRGCMWSGRGSCAAAGAGAARGVRRRPDRGHQPLLPRGHADVGVGGGHRRVPPAGPVHAQWLRHRQLLRAPPHGALWHPRRRAGARLRALLRRRLRHLTRLTSLSSTVPRTSSQQLVQVLTIYFVAFSV